MCGTELAKGRARVAGGRAAAVQGQPRHGPAPGGRLHGVPSDENAHPHVCRDRSRSCGNGTIIENASELLRAKLAAVA